MPYTLTYGDGCSLRHDACAVGPRAHQAEHALVTVVVGKGTARVGKHAFAGCDKLARVVLPPGLTSLDEGAFKNTAVRAIVVPEGVIEVGARCFAGTPLEHLLLPPGVVDTGCAAFSKTKIVLLSLPSTVTNVADESFRGCQHLLTVAFGPAVMRVGDNTFRGCTKLNLSNAPLSRATRHIGRNAFAGCAGIESLVLPDLLRTLGGGAFAKCTGLRVMIVGHRLAALPAGGFMRCTSLDHLCLGSITQIGPRCFSGCRLADPVQLPEGLLSIGADAFFESGIGLVSLPDTCVQVGPRAFEGCSRLTHVRLPHRRWRGGIPTHTVGMSAFAHTAVGAVVVPAGVKLGARAFEHSRVKDLHIASMGEGELCITVPRYCFYGCPITTVVIPSGCPRVSGHAFGANPSLTRVWIGGETELSNDAFSDSPNVRWVVTEALRIEALRIIWPHATFQACNNIPRVRRAWWHPSRHLWACTTTRAAVATMLTCQLRAHEPDELPNEIVFMVCGFLPLAHW